MKLSASVLALAVQGYEFDVFLRGGKDGVWTWRDAKNYCMSLKDGWQLAIIDSPAKQDAALKAFLDAGATEQDAAWIGFENEDGWGVNNAAKDDTMDLYGNRAKYTNYAEFEPNNKYGNPKEERGEDCVKMRADGKWEDALCGRKHTVKPKRGKKGIYNSFICEPKPLEAVGECVPKVTAPTSDRYEVVPASTISFPAAREACQLKGAQWDLVVLESVEELAFVKSMINCLPEAFWIGYRQRGTLSLDIIKNKPSQIQMPWEVNKADGSPDEPNGEDNECVRLRNGKTNDARCTIQFSGTMRENLGMGYICERHANLVPTQPPKVEIDNDRFSTCEENEWGIQPFKVRPGCATPLYCQAEIEILDAWTRTVDRRTNTKRYGLAARVSVTSELLSKSKGRGYSVLLRFPQTLTKASYQVWNINFFNFYKGGTEVLLHSKWWISPDNEGFDPQSNSFIIIVDNMDVQAHPTVVAFTGRQSRHQCFDPSMHMGQRAGSAMFGDSQSPIRAAAQGKYEGDVTLENVQKIRMSKGQLKEVKAAGKRQRKIRI